MMLKSLMKSKSVFVLFLFSCFFGISNSGYSIENKTRIGFGTTIESRLVTSHETYKIYAMSLTAFRLPVFIKSKFKIEPDFAFWSQKFGDKYSESTNSLVRYGCGFYFTKNFEKTSLSFGPRITINHLGTAYKSKWDNNKLSKNDFAFGFAFGGEYFLSEHFSLGSEIQLNYWHLGKDDNRADSSASSLKNEALIIFRFYL